MYETTAFLRKSALFLLFDKEEFIIIIIIISVHWATKSNWANQNKSEMSETLFLGCNDAAERQVAITNM